jgi:hypothetical protein
VRAVTVIQHVNKYRYMSFTFSDHIKRLEIKYIEFNHDISLLTYIHIKSSYDHPIENRYAGNMPQM